MWFAWEMAYQKWGIELPWVGDARLWTKLDGVRIVSGDWEYKLDLSPMPVPDSIAIFQPWDLDTLAGGTFPNDFHGHVAWVESIPAPFEITVLESTVYPPPTGSRWHGCWWTEKVYDLSNLKTVRFLYIKEERNIRTGVQGPPHPIGDALFGGKARALP